jgi:hypothetical protein
MMAGQDVKGLREEEIVLLSRSSSLLAVVFLANAPTVGYCGAMSRYLLSRKKITTLGEHRDINTFTVG